MAPRTPSTVEAGNVEAELPSYSIASGLPSYEEALEQLKKVKELTGYQEKRRAAQSGNDWVPQTPPTPVHLSVTNLFQNYARTNSNSQIEAEVKPS
ncbi:hypothetical protein HHI36_006568 [Cryptolaemus montrouzieri]|uniref:Uncharacterized protein n=1 Tax=Cryptolaemus montrouzieri TaxID=559131 RepID=A0ABD2NXH4_9CUCU